MNSTNLNALLRDALMRYATRLRFPKLLAATLAVFALDVIIPDLLPFADEILLGLVSLMLASLRRDGHSHDGSARRATGAGPRP